eukprot:NODE_3030_length_827_cov_47.218509_g2517_i0.p1 GENE.NODE_3030_length_827_cov_47.218509_g2517_i0~~NODE_3030_length_827_cov_47.218509_g2517_i0.p1  ORF type:complete len:175 (-),score=24.43 NODE_3030_length_827_cov_47.218509_g2517_i0:64-588(-)
MICGVLQCSQQRSGWQNPADGMDVSVNRFTATKSHERYVQDDGGECYGIATVVSEATLQPGQVDRLHFTRLRLCMAVGVVPANCIPGRNQRINFHLNGFKMFSDGVVYGPGLRNRLLGIDGFAFSEGQVVSLELQGRSLVLRRGSEVVRIPLPSGEWRSAAELWKADESVEIIV